MGDIIIKRNHQKATDYEIFFRLRIIKKAKKEVQDVVISVSIKVFSVVTFMQCDMSK